MSEDKNNSHDRFTVTGTNIDDVKRQNEHSGLSYNEIKEVLAKKMVDHDTGIDSNSNIDEVSNKN